MSYLIAALALPATLLPIFSPAEYSAFIPLLGWTLALQWFIDEYYAFSAWTIVAAVPADPRAATDQALGSAETVSYEQRDELLGRWFQNWFHRGRLCAVLFTPLTFSSSLVVLYRHFSTSASVPIIDSPATWTAVGLALSTYHIRYGNSQYRPFKRIGTAGNEGSNTRDLTGWLEMHQKRILFIDGPAWFCFAMATARSIRA